MAICFLTKVNDFSPYLYIKYDTSKNLIPRETVDAKIKITKFIPNIPEAKQVTLKGNGDMPPKIINKTPKFKKFILNSFTELKIPLK